MSSENLLSQDLDHILDHTYDLWKELNGESIFITGGTGFIGCWLLESIIWASKRLNLNLQTTVLTRDPIGFAQKAPHLTSSSNIQFLTGDVRNFIFPSRQFSLLIHGAADASAKLSLENPNLMYETITLGTKRVLDFAISNQVQKFLFLSSGAVYGKQPYEITNIPENFAWQEEHDECKLSYSRGKRDAEKLCIEAAKKNNFAAKIARCFAFVGPHLPFDTHFAIGNFILNGLKSEPIRITGDGTPLRSYLYASDLIIWLWHILLRGEDCTPYNVGSEDKISISDLARLVAGHFSPPLNIKIDQSPMVGRLPDSYVPSTKLAQKNLGLKQFISLDEAIVKTIQWGKKNL